MAATALVVGRSWGDRRALPPSTRQPKRPSITRTIRTAARCATTTPPRGSVADHGMMGGMMGRMGVEMMKAGICELVQGRISPMASMTTIIDGNRLVFDQII